MSHPVDLHPQTVGYGFQAIVQQQRLTITGLYAPSPVASAGLRVGDQILVINGDDYSNPTSGEACDYINRPVGGRYQGHITMTVQRQGNTLTYRIYPNVFLGSEEGDN